MATNNAPVQGPFLRKEPAGTIGTAITAILTGVWLVLKASGVEIAEDLPTAINALIAGLLMVPAITGWLTRFFVVSPANARKAVDKAAATGETFDPMNPETWQDPPMPEPIRGRQASGPIV